MTATSAAPDGPPMRIGISSCLLGEQVRYDGGHKHDRFLTDVLGRYVQFVPTCPEVAMGLPVPRPTLRLERHGDELRMVMPKTGQDLTGQMRRFAKARIATLVQEELCGYVLKNRSPSCGIKVRAFTPKGTPARSAPGLFAQALTERFPHLPVTEEGRLRDPSLRENWIERVFAYHRLRTLWSNRWSIGDLVAFHTRHKFLLLAHWPPAYQHLGRLVASAKSLPRKEIRRQYEEQFMEGLAKIATPWKNANVLLHIVGFFKKNLDKPSRDELLEIIEDYRRGLVPLIVPVTLVRHHVRVQNVEYLRDQYYLNPHPKELALRNHV